jgi:hypothetical protein
MFREVPQAAIGRLAGRRGSRLDNPRVWGVSCLDGRDRDNVRGLPDFEPNFEGDLT